MRFSRIAILLVLLLATFVATAQPSGLRFRDDGTFRIMQLTDLHYNGTGWHSDHVPPMLARLIDREKPDLIIVTGDLIYRRPGAALMTDICGTIASHGIPYAITLGNHDAEQAITHAELYALLRTLPGCVNGTYETPGAREGDFIIPVVSHDGQSVEARVYVMDSNDYNADDHSYKGFTTEQVDWYKAQCAAAHKDGNAYGLIFCHIPLHEFAKAYQTAPLTGVRLEKECPARDNTGMFRAIADGGEAVGLFAGHDHSNNYIAELEGISLGYGHYSGGYGEYQELVSGARMILLEEGKRGFTTWVRLANDREKYRMTFPKE